MYQLDRRTNELVGYCSGRSKRFRRNISSLLGATFMSANPVNLPDIRKSSHYEPTLDSLPSIKASSMLLVPVLSQLGVPIGLIQAVNKIKQFHELQCTPPSDDTSFSSKDQSILESLANQVGDLVTTRRYPISQNRPSEV